MQQKACSKWGNIGSCSCTLTDTQTEAYKVDKQSRRWQAGDSEMWVHAHEVYDHGEEDFDSWL